MDLPSKQELMALSPSYLAEDDSQKLMNTSIAFVIVPTFIFVLFIISRYMHGAGNTWEYFILYPLSYLLTIGLCIIGFLLIEIGGAGRHMAHFLLTDPTVITRYLQLQTATEFIYMASITAPKLAMLTLILKFVRDRGTRLFTWTVIGVVIVNFWVCGVIVGLTICQPFAFKWDKTIANGHCADLLAAYRYVSVPNILTDLAILVLPFPTLWKLQIDKLQKVGVLLTLLVGGAGVVTSIYRFVGFFTAPLLDDPTYYTIETMTLSIIEPGTYFICVCIPGIRPLAYHFYQKTGLVTVVEKTFKSTNSHSRGTSNRPDHNGIPLSSSNHSGNRFKLPSASSFRHDDQHRDHSGFIQLEQTVVVTRSPGAGSSDGSTLDKRDLFV